MEAVSTFRQPGAKILVVDNNPFFLKFLSDTLSAEGFIVFSAGSGLEALSLLDAHRFTAVFVDLVMPNIGGDKLCQIIRSRPEGKAVRLIILSAIAPEADLDFRALGADACIAKGPMQHMKEHILAVLARLAAGNQVPDGIIGLENVVKRHITEELLLFKHHYEMTLGNLTEGILEIAMPTAQVTYANRAAVELFGLAEENILGTDFLGLFPQRCIEEVRRMLAKVGPGGAVVSGTHLVSAKSRLISLNLLHGADGSAYGYRLAILQDVTERTVEEYALQMSRNELHQIFHNAAEGMLVIDMDYNILRMNTPFTTLFGVTESPHLQKCHEIFPGPRCHTAACSLNRIRQGEERVECEEDKRRADGSIIPVQFTAIPFRGPDGELLGVMEHCRDISAQRRAEEELRNSSERFRAIFDNTLVGILFATSDRIIADLNDRALELLGYAREELIGESLAILHLSPDHYARFGEEVLAKKNAGRLIQMEYQLRRKDGAPVWASLSGKAIRLSDLGEGMLWVADDITRRKQAEEDQRQIIEELREMQEALRNQSIRDPLTGLFNRRYMEESLQREISKARRQASSLALFMLDLDRFKQINDTHGHVTGDWVLSRLGEIIRHNIREEDIACRYGGEEFILIFPGISAADAQRKAEELRANVEQHLVGEHMGQPVGGITISIGVAMHEPGMDRETLLREADRALYRAKKEGRNRVVM
jgi:diguanylate cyclase (GGDEF)-like protein/PAS domain S-box-containing protein